MDVYYGVPFRVGGTGPGMRLLIGAWAELGEEPIPIDLYVCPQCGRMEQFASKKTRDRLKRAAPHTIASGIRNIKELERRQRKWEVESRSLGATSSQERVFDS